MEISMRVICFNSSGVFWLACQAYIMTSSKAGSPSETPTPTLSSLFLPSCLCSDWLGFLQGILGLVRLPVLLLPVTNLLASMTGGVFHWAVVSQECGIEDILSAIVMCVQHTASISAIVPSTNSFLIRSVSLRAHTIRTRCVFPSFSSYVGKLHLSTNPQICSTSSSGVSPALILISSSW